MTRISRTSYEVACGETITITTTPFEVPAEMIVCAVNGRAIEPDPDDPPTFVFAAPPKNGGIVIAVLSAEFPEGSHSMARFELHVAGSEGGDFSARTIFNADPTHDCTLDFTVTA